MSTLSIYILTAIQSLAASRDSERGQTLAEYGLILSVVAVTTVVVAVVLFRGSIIGSFGGATNCLTTASTTSPSC